MSTGKFDYAKYETNDGLVVPVKIQPETLTLTLNSVANAQGSGSLTPFLPSARVGGSKKQIGINARTVTVRLTADGAGENAGMKSGSLIRLPVFLPATYAAYSKGDVGTYKGIACEYAGHSAENVV